MSQLELQPARTLDSIPSLRGRVTLLEEVLRTLPQATAHMGFDYCAQAAGRACDCGHASIAKALGREAKP